MEVSLTNNILAIVTLKNNENKVDGGGSPVFYVDDEEELEYVAMLISRLTLSMAHNLGNGVYILIKH
ncbi:capping complex subunit for YIEGIA [Selenihalanaerobacter shriftii]|uniref:Uncharacterized protein n=1 Tax=Selenihalanaerobacter shriftii TaxID=142842 RepID=A0A1T4LIF5_9FIRM|nr:hypothetical protein [Selenihalanaerobacter shriftii]SJZ54347.1 hypothetical protein SAMN02745118_01149 [Selenihalanaerobacter shriftii]